MNHRLLRLLRCTLIGYFCVVWVAVTACAAEPKRAAEPPNPVASGQLPRYIFFNKAPTEGGAAGWYQTAPDRFTPASCRDIVDKLGTSGNEKLRIGVSFIFSILESEPRALGTSLERLLAAAQAADVPILITLDGQNYWESRPDLWNWWDPGLPGYSPSNRFNVEWTDWSPQNAIKVSWRNWGHQLRVRPAPNIASPRFLSEHWKRFDVLIPLIVRWYRSLPPDKKYLFGGLKVGWEASINVNAWYFRDGNRLFEQSPKDSSNDPQDHDLKKGWTFGQSPLGYAAVSTSGLKRNGELTRQDIETVVHQYLEQLSRHTARRGIPPSLIFTHQGGTYAPWDQHMSFKPAMNASSIPGWSFYDHDPDKSGSLAADLEAAGREQWAACEWWRGAADQAGWARNFRQSLDFKQCRFVCVYNWHQFVKDAAGLAAVRQVVAEGRSAPQTDRPKPR